MFMRTKPYWTPLGSRGEGAQRAADAPRRAPRMRSHRSPRDGLRAGCADAPSGTRSRPAKRVSVAVCPTSTPPPPPPCTPSPGRRCSPRWTRAGPTPPGCYREGRRARLLLDAAREAAAEAVGCRPGRAGLHPFGDRRGAHRDRRGARRPPARRAPPGRLRRRALRRCCTRRTAHEAAGGTVTEVPVDRTGRVSADAYAAALTRRTPRWPACSRPTTRWAPSSRWPRWPRRAGQAGVPLLVDAAQSLGWGPVAGGWSLLAGERPQVGRPARGRAARRAQGGAVRRPKGPPDERESGPRAGLREHPGDRRRGGLAAGRTGRGGGRGGAAAGAGGPDPGAGAGAGAGCGGGRRSGAAAARTSSPSPVSMSTGRPCCTSWTGRASRSRPVRPVRRSTLTPSHVLRAMGVLSEGNVRVSLPPSAGGAEARVPAVEADVERFLEVLPGVVRGVREQLGAPAAPGSAAGGTSSPSRRPRPPACRSTRWASCARSR